MKRSWIRWAPAAAVPVVIAVGVATTGAAAPAAPPPATAEQVLALVAAHRAQQFSGDVEQTTDLGLPSIPSQALAPATGSATAGSEASALDLLTGTHTARVYADGPTRQRVQVVDQLAERDAIRNGAEVWTWDSKANRATHATLPAALTATTPTPSTTLSPDDLARRFLTAAGPSTDVTLGSPATVAGHGTYTLVLTPRTSGTLVGSVRIAVEAQTGLPLAVDVFAKGQATPAVHVAMTSLDLQAPAASVFAFTPPAGATVEQQQLPARTPAHTGATTRARTDLQQAASSWRWDAVAVIPASRVPADLAASPLVGQFATPVTGGRLLSTSLVNVLLTADGRIVAGAVPASTLEAAAAR